MSLEKGLSGTFKCIQTAGSTGDDRNRVKSLTIWAEWPNGLRAVPAAVAKNAVRLLLAPMEPHADVDKHPDRT